MMRGRKPCIHLELTESALWPLDHRPKIEVAAGEAHGPATKSQLTLYEEAEDAENDYLGKTHDRFYYGV